MGIKLRRGIGFVLFVLSIILLLWGFRPTPHLEKHLVGSPEGLMVAAQDAFAGPADSTDPGRSVITNPAGQVKLRWPIMIRAGDLAEIRLIIEPAFHGDPVGDPGTNAEGEPESTSYGQMGSFSAHLDLPGIRFSPMGEIGLAKPIDNPATFLWSLRPEDVGNYQGSLWLYFHSGDGNNGDTTRKVLLNQLVDLSVRSFLGLTGQQARLLGGVGILIGAYILIQSIFQASQPKANKID